MSNWRIKDIAGQRFGRLVVIEVTNKRSSKGVVWRCQCDCGKIKLIASHSLCRGSTKSCGCLHDEKTSDRSLVDITGEKYGRLLVLKLLSKRRQNHYAMWECRCDCGNISNVAGSDLRAGGVNSCGCLRIIDLVGQRYGKLIVLELTSDKSRGSTIWKCRCDCGNIVFIPSSSLRHNRTKSCGCLLIASRFVHGTKIDPMNVPIEIIKCFKAHNELRKAIKQAS